MRTKDFKRAEIVCKALANKRRIVILDLLREREYMSVGEIAKSLKLSLESTSRHLSILYKAELLDREQKSLLVRYFLNTERTQLLKYTQQLLAHLAK